MKLETVNLLHFGRCWIRVAEVLPGGSDDHKTVVNLLTNKENLMVESKQMEEQKPKQQDIFNQN